MHVKGFVTAMLQSRANVKLDVDLACYTQEMNAGRRLRQLRLGRGWSQEQLAIQARRFAPGASLARETISRIENGHRPPDLWVLEACAKALGVGVDALLREDTPPTSGMLIAEDRPSYTTDIDVIAAQLSRLPAARRAQAIDAISGVLGLAIEAETTAAEPEEDPRQADRRRRLFRLFDQLSDEDLEKWIARIQHEAAAIRNATARTG